MSSGDDPPNGSASPDSEEQAPGDGPVALVTEADTPQRAIASLSTGRDLRNDAEAAQVAAVEAEAQAAEAEALAEAREADVAAAEVRVAEATTSTTAPPATAPPTTAPPTTQAPPAVTSDVWDRIAACESGGNWATNTGNGYYGGLQFLLSTWQLNGGTQYAAYPHEASREAQIAVAERVVAASGGSYSAWGGCAASLGLP